MTRLERIVNTLAALTLCVMVLVVCWYIMLYGFTIEACAARGYTEVLVSYRMGYCVGASIVPAW